MIESNRSATADDIAIGAIIKRFRQDSGISQQDIADAIGVKHQQVQKYETGQNRIAAVRLNQIAQYLGVSIGDFFPVDPEDWRPIWSCPEGVLVETKVRGDDGKFQNLTMRKKGHLFEIDGSPVLHRPTHWRPRQMKGAQP